MTTNISSEPKPKRQRIIIITGDDSVIDQIQKIDNISSCKSIVLDTLDEDIQLSHSTIETITSKKLKDDSLTCVICGSRANGYNFDVISCESCKSFFRRNALRNPPLKCLHQGTCDINYKTRRRCSACRLTRCFNSGMRRERLLVAEQKAETRRSQRENQTSNEPQIDPSPPSVSANNLNSILDQELSLFSECLQGNSIPSKKGLLTPEDLQRLETIELLYKKRVELAHDGTPSYSPMYTTTFLQEMNRHSVPLLRLLTFFKQIPEFDALNVDDKVTLIKFNLLPLLCINCTLSYQPETNTIAETESDIPWESSAFEVVYGVDGYQDIKKIFEQFLHIAKYDQKIIQLILIAFILTKGLSPGHEDEPILNDSMAVYRAQNYYAELLWKYMETVHGSNIAIQIFSKIIAHFMTWQTMHPKFRHIIETNLSSTNTNEILPFMKAILHIS